MSTTGLYTILIDACRVRWYPHWLPWGTKRIVLQKTTTWQDAQHSASLMVENGALGVSVFPGEPVEKATRTGRVLNALGRSQS